MARLRSFLFSGLILSLFALPIVFETNGYQQKPPVVETATGSPQAADRAPASLIKVDETLRAKVHPRKATVQ